MKINLVPLFDLPTTLQSVLGAYTQYTNHSLFYILLSYLTHGFFCSSTFQFYPFWQSDFPFPLPIISCKAPIHSLLPSLFIEDYLETPSPLFISCELLLIIFSFCSALLLDMSSHANTSAGTCFASPHSNLLVL